MENQTQKPKKKIYKRWWFWVLAVIVIFIIIGSSGSKNTTSNNSTQSAQNGAQQQAPTIQVTAAELSADYKANQVAADTKYKGKIIQVTGTISNIGKDILDTPYVSLNTGDIITGVQCMFDKSDQSQLATLAKDTRITLQGKVKGELMNVLLDNCSIVK